MQERTAPACFYRNGVILLFEVDFGSALGAYHRMHNGVRYSRSYRKIFLLHILRIWLKTAIPAYLPQAHKPLVSTKLFIETDFATTFFNHFSGAGMRVLVMSGGVCNIDGYKNHGYLYACE
jgi:hypothetical protein